MISLGQASVSLSLRDVFKDGVALRVGTRAFDILELLIRHQGQRVSKEQILEHVWPDTVVEENNLQVHISALRKALGSDRDLIRTIPGRGYLLLGDDPTTEARVTSEKATRTPMPQAPGGESRLPADVTPMGRKPLLKAINDALAGGHAVTTLIGPGGVGKTCLAIALGHAFARHSTAVFVPLAQLSRTDSLPQALARALGIEGTGDDALMQSLTQRLGQRPGLIILDNCEHVIDQVAGFVEGLLQRVPAVRILATSREPLRIAGERALHVPPLTVPAPDAPREVVLRSGSAQLFLRQWRAFDCMANPANVELDDFSVQLVSEVCRRLDGIPLALEMAAARASTLGLYQLVASLDDSVHLLTAGLRNAPARQQTLQACLAWSYRSLSQDERAVLRLLADLEGKFTLEQACHALQSANLARSCITDCMIRLATKSLLMVTARGPFRFYRMLKVTCACLRAVQGEERPREPLRLDPRYGHPAPAQPLRAVPVGAEGYHAHPQRALVVGR